MAFYEVYSHPALIRYKTSVCTKATLFLVAILCLTYISPLLVAYRSQGTARSGRTVRCLCRVREFETALDIQGFGCRFRGKLCCKRFTVVFVCKTITCFPFRVLDKKKYLWGTTRGQVPVRGSAGGSHQSPGRPRDLEYLPVSEQHAGTKLQNPGCFCETLVCAVTRVVFSGS